MRIQWKIVALVLAAVVVTVATIVWRTQSILVQDKMNIAADAAMKSMAPLKRLVQERLRDNQGELVRFASVRIARGPGQWRALGSFEIVSLLQPNANGQWAPAWVEKSPALPADRWPIGHDQALLRSLPAAKVKDGEILWVRLSDRRGLPVYAVLFSAEMRASISTAGKDGTLPDDVFQPGGTDGGRRSVLVGLTSNDPLASVTEDFIGSTSIVYIVDDKGYVASHVNRTNVGALLNDDPVVKAVMAGKKASATESFRDADNQETLARFERVPNTNLSVVIATPVAPLMAANGDLRKLMMGIGFFVAFAGATIAWILGRPISESLQQAVRSLHSINRGEANVEFKGMDDKSELGELMRLLSESSPAALASKASFTRNADTSRMEEADSSVSRFSKVNISPAMTPDRLADDRRAIFESFEKGFARVVNEPLNSILGHATLIAVKASAPEIKAHAESISRETRQAQAVLESLREWDADQPASTHEKINMPYAVEAALAVMKPLLDEDGIEVIRDLHPVPEVQGSTERMTRAIIKIIENAIEAMKARPTRQLKVQLDFLSDSIFLAISDTGIGMSRDVREKAFEPFYRGFDSPGHMGLGLAFVRGIARSLKGNCNIETTPGEGASITLSVPVREAEKAEFFAPGSAAPAAPAAAAVTQTDAESSSETTLWPIEVAANLDVPENLPATKDSDDDDDESFQSVRIGGKDNAPIATMSSSGPEPTPEPTMDSSGEFRVKVRRPRRAGS